MNRGVVPDAPKARAGTHGNAQSVEVGPGSTLRFGRDDLEL